MIAVLRNPDLLASHSLDDWADLMALAKSGKAVILPHMGSATIEGRQEMGDRVIINIRTFFDGHRPPDRVLPNDF